MCAIVRSFFISIEMSFYWIAYILGHANTIVEFLAEEVRAFIFLRIWKYPTPKYQAYKKEGKYGPQWIKKQTNIKILRKDIEDRISKQKHQESHYNNMSFVRQNKVKAC